MTGVMKSALGIGLLLGGLLLVPLGSFGVTVDSRRFLRTIILIVGLVGGLVSPAFAVSILTVSLDTLALSGTSAQLAFDLTDGDLAANNVATITGFSTDGGLGAASTTGGASGALPGTITITDTIFFNELLQDITLGNTTTFTLELTTNYSGSGVPDAFAFFLLDATSGLPLFPTADPTGADALFAVDITGTALGDLQVFSTTVQVVTSVPEPAPFWLIVAGMGGLAARRRWSRRLRTTCLTPREYVDGQIV